MNTIIFFGICLIILTYAFHEISLWLSPKSNQKVEDKKSDENQSSVSNEPFRRLSVFNKKIERLQEELKLDKKNQPDDSLNELLVIKELIDFEYTNKSITKKIYTDFFNAFDEILSLIDEFTDLEKIIKKNKIKEKDLKTSYQVVEEKFSKEIKKGFIKKREENLALIENLTKRLSECVKSQLYACNKENLKEVENSISQFTNSYEIHKRTELELNKFQNEVDAEVKSEEKIYPIDLSLNVVKSDEIVRKLKS